jgi:hypothetical protein
MKGWKRLENINPVSGKLREAHIDCLQTGATGHFQTFAGFTWLPQSRHS